MASESGVPVRRPVPVRPARSRRVPKSAQFAASYCQDCPVRRECGAEADDNRDEGVRGGRWRANTSHGYRSYEITPLTSKAIRVINHDTRFPSPERTAS
jgi:hypothetical protein